MTNPSGVNPRGHCPECNDEGCDRCKDWERPPIDKPSDLQRLLGGYMAIRDRRSALKREYEEESGNLKRKLDLIELALMKLMKESGSENLKIAGVAQAYLTTKTFTKGKDWDALWKYIEESGNLALLQRRISATAVKEFMEANDGDLPPGVDVTTERVVAVRTA